MTMAVAHSGRNAGVTVAEVNLKLIWDVITAIKIGKTGYAYVVDDKGRLIAHPDISRVLRNTDLSGLPQVAAAGDPSAAGADPAAIVRNLDGHRVLSASAAIPKLGWLDVERGARTTLHLGAADRSLAGARARRRDPRRPAARPPHDGADPRARYRCGPDRRRRARPSHRRAYR
jgi:hypothetical protein